MKKITAILLIAAIMLSVSACGLTPGGENESEVIYLDEPTDENVKKIEPIKNMDTEEEDDGIAPADEPGILDDGTEGEDEVGEGEGESEPASAQGVPLNIYFSDDTGIKFMSYATEIEKLDAKSVVGAMRSIGVLDSGVKVVSFSTTQDGGKNILKLDLNASFSAQMKDFGTFAGYMLMGSVVNTFLEAFDGDSIIVTAGNMNLTGYSGKLTKFGSNPNSPDAEEQTEEAAENGESTEGGTAKKKASDSNPVVATALSLEGAAFENGATGPTTFDNSGFVYYCFKANGISIPRKTSAMYDAGSAVGKDELQKGDVIFYDLDGSGKPTYVAVYLGDGKAMTESVGSNAATVIKLSTKYYADRYFGARRYS